jgi:hypothetical protein
MTRTFRQSAATPNTAPITTINGFWQSKPPAGVHPHIIQVAVPIPAAEVSAVAPDPEALALWVICKKPKERSTVRLFMGTKDDATQLTEEATPLNSRTVTGITVRPGVYQGGRQVAVIEGPDASLWSSHQPKSLNRLPAGTCRARFNPDGTLLAYGTRKGALGVLKVIDASDRGRAVVALEHAMSERVVREAKADDWVLTFNASGDRLYFIKVVGGERLTGWITVPNGIAYTIKPTFDTSADDWAFAIGPRPKPLKPVNPAPPELVCFGGITYECHIGSPSPGEEVLRRIRISPESPWVEDLALMDEAALVIRTKRAVWAVDPNRCTSDHTLVIGRMPSAAHVERFHHLGTWTNPDGMRTLFTIVTQKAGAIEDDACVGKNEEANPTS